MATVGESAKKLSRGFLRVYLFFEFEFFLFDDTVTGYRVCLLPIPMDFIRVIF